MCVLTMISLLMLPSFAFADNAQEQILFTQKEIKDKTILFDRAVKQISDIQEQGIKAEAYLVNSSTRNIEIVKTFKTTQFLKSVVFPDGSKQESYATTAFALSGYDGYYTPPAGWDRTIGVKAYSTIYWNYYYNPQGVKYFKLEHADGGWQIYDNRLSLTNKTVLFGMSGSPMSGSSWGQSKYYYPTSTTYSYSAPSSFIPIRYMPAASIGDTMSCTVNSGGGSSWNFSFVNSYSPT